MENAPIRISSYKQENSKKKQLPQKLVKNDNRSLRVFESAIRSEYTRRNYRITLKKFMDFVEISDYDKLAGIPDMKLQKLLEDYIIFLKTQDLNPNSFPVMLTSLQLFFSMNDRVLNFKKVKKLFPETIKRSGYSAYDTRHVQLLLKVTTDLRNRAIILFLASTGVRVGALEGLKIKHLKNMPDGCKRVVIYESTKEEYITFLSPEAAKALDSYLEKRRNDGEMLTLESPLFRDKYDTRATLAHAMRYRGHVDVLKRLMRKSGLAREKNGSRYNIQLCHGFRKRFNTILKANKEINSNIAEKLMGHKNGLDGTYFVPTEEQCFAEFQKAIKDLIVDDSERLLVQNRELEIKLSEKENLEDEIQRQKQAIDYLLSKDPEAKKHLENGKN
ncbi:MAG: tyrosine-type recombinase/integrase [Nitrosotalea sp.]